MQIYFYCACLSLFVSSSVFSSKQHLLLLHYLRYAQLHTTVGCITANTTFFTLLYFPD